MEKFQVLKNKKCKRVIAMLMAICLIIGIIPAEALQSRATEDPGSETYVYNFYKLWTGEGWNTGTDIKTVTSFDQTTMGNDAEINKGVERNGELIKTDPWIYNGVGGGAAMYFSDETYANIFEALKDEWASVKIRVPSSGVYKTISTNGNWTNGANIRIFLAPDDDGVNPRDAQYEIGTIDTLRSSNTWIEDTTLKTLNLKQQDYILTYQMLSPNTDRQNGRKLAVSAFKIQKQQSKIGITTGKLPQLTVGTLANVELNVTNVGAAVDLDQVTNKDVSVKDAQIATASIEKDAINGKYMLNVNCLKEGKTIITVTVDVDGKLGILGIPIEVAKQRSLQFNFMKLWGGVEWNVGTDIKTVTSFDQTTMGSNAEINKGVKLDEELITTDPWIYNSGNIVFGENSYGCLIKGAEGDSTSLKLHVTQSGTYRPTSKNAFPNFGTSVKVYLAPDKNGINPVDGQYLLGTVNSYYWDKLPKTESWRNDAPLRLVTLDAGDYVLTYVNTNKHESSSGVGFPVSSFNLNVVDQINYNFHKIWKNEGYKVANDITTITSFDQTSMGNPNEINPGFWNNSCDKENFIQTEPWIFMNKSSGASFGYEDDTYGCMLKGDVGTWTSLKIRVPYKGLYQTVSRNATWTSGGKYQIYLAPDEPGVNARDPKYAIGTIDTYQSTNKWDVDTPLNIVSLDAKDYILTYETLEKNPQSGGSLLFVGGFKLKPQDAKLALTVGSVAPIVIGDSGSAKISVYLGTSSVDLSKATAMTAESDDANIATASIVKNEAGDYMLTVQSKNIGKTSIRVNVTIAGENLSAVVPVEIKKPKPLNYNLFKLHIESWNIGTDITTVKSFNQTTMGDPEEINKTQGVVTDPWHYVASGGGCEIRFEDSSYACFFKGQKGGWSRLKIRVPKDGVYQTVTTNGMWNGGKVIRLYLAPDASSVNPMDMQYCLGTLDTYNATNSWTVDNPLRIMNLKAGDYVLTYEMVGNSSYGGNYGVAIGGFKLDMPTEHKFFLGSKSVPPISLGRTVAQELIGEINGIPTNLENATISVSSKNKDIADAVLRKDAQSGKFYVDIKGNALGDTVIDIEATCDGLSQTYQMPVSVKEPDMLYAVDFTAEKTQLKTRESTTTTVKGNTVDGNPVDPKQIKIYYQSSDPRVAVVDASGVILAKTAGKTTISMFMNKDKITLEKKIEITVNDDTALKSVEINGACGVVRGGTLQLKVTGTRESGSTGDVTDADITFEVISATPEGSVTVTKDGNLNAIKVGSAQIKAIVKPEGSNVLETAPVTVQVLESAAEDVVINFKNIGEGKTPLDATLTEQGWQIDQNKTAEDTMKNTQKLSFNESGIVAKVSQTAKQRESDIAISFNIQQGGAYTFDFTGGSSAVGCEADIYVDNTYMGNCKFTGDNAIVGEKALLNSIILQPGTHNITFRRMSSGDNDTMLLGKLTLHAQNGLPQVQKVQIKNSKPIMSVGESTNIVANILMSNGIPLRLGKRFDGSMDPDNNIQIVSSTPEILALENNGTIRAMASGEGKLTVTAKVAGKEYTETCNIVVDKQTIKSIIASLENPQMISGLSTKLLVNAKTSDGRLVDMKDLKISCESSNSSVLTVDGTTLYALAAGEAQLTITAELAGVRQQTTVIVTIKPENSLNFELFADTSIMKPDATGIQLKVRARNSENKEIDLSGKKIEYINKNPDIVIVMENGFVCPIKVGDAVVEAKVTIDGITLSDTYTITVSEGKTASTYYTPERVLAARENAKKYQWAKDTKDDAIKKADIYIDKQDFLWESVTTQELPRGITVGYRYDPKAYTCRYCGTDLRADYGYYPWLMDRINEPWKLKCPSCRRKFPSNDFESFYKLGINENGNWSYDLAKEKNAELLAQGKDGYLKNVLYPEKGEGWGVDDGYGYKTGKVEGNGVEEVHTYVAYYNHWGIWHSGLILQALDSLKNAYMFTGDTRYGRVGATLIDRVADVYPDMFIAPYYPNFYNSDSTSPYGKAVGRIWETGVADQICQAYDAFYPAMDDPQVVNYLAKHAAQYKMKNTKETPKQIRQNCEDGILREVRRAIETLNIDGNFGMHQASMAYAAVVLDNNPETTDMINWIFKSGGPVPVNGGYKVTGGNVLAQVMKDVSRDGIGGESAPGYNSIWVSQPMRMAEALAIYGKSGDNDLFKNPKYYKTFSAMLPLTLCRRATAQIGDSGNTASVVFNFIGIPQTIKGYQYTKDPRVAQFIYLMNGNKTDGLHADIFTKNPEGIRDDIQKVIDTYGEYDLDKSDQLAGYGFSILRGGSYYPTSVSTNTVDTQRDFWMYYGTSYVHGHPSALNLGIEAYGLNMAPDLGYPAVVDGGEEYSNWSRSTVNHNTVMVNNRKQGYIAINGKPMHFDDSGRVKVMDADAKQAYSETSIYRRTVVMVEASDDISYGVDFFRIKGGDDHLYSFHSQSDEIFETQGLNLVQQPMGSYQGPNIEWKTPGYASGYAWLHNVRRAQYPGTGEFSVDFKVKDFRKTLSQEMNLHLRMTMLNNFDLSEVSIVSGAPPQVENNPKSLEFMIARRTGKNLDTLFTTVYEPYKDNRYIESMEQVDAIRVGGAAEQANDIVKAVKVTLKSGRVDYIVYASNNAIEYRVDNTFNFRGFVGVYTLKDNSPIYSYLNDGDKIGDMSGIGNYTGKVTGFTKTHEFKNTMTVRFDQEVDVDRLVGQFIYVENDGTQNAAYPIKGATSTDNRTVTLELDDLTLIRAHKNPDNLDEGYVYNIAEGQSFNVPLPIVNDSTPIIQPLEKQRGEVGRELRFTITAKSPAGKDLSYSANTLPYGAQFDPKTHTFSWIPGQGQVGNNHASFDVTDGILTSTVHVKIDVYNGTGGKTDPINNNNQNNQQNQNNNQNNQNNQNNNENNQNPEIKQSVEVKSDTKLVSGIAAVEPKKDDVIKGINGAEKVIINVSEVKDAKSYSVKLPVDVVTNNSLNRDVEVKTPAGNIILPTEMLANDASMVTSKDAKVAVTLTKTDKTLKVDLAVNGKEYNWSNINVPVKIESTYKPSEEMKNTTCIIIKDTQGNIIPSGKYENGSITVYATKLGGEYSVSYNEKSFNDLEKHNWASEAITGLAARGIINGTSESTYSPANNITRADFITLVVRALGLKAESADNFLDVNANDYFAKEVGIAKSLGIVTGQGDNKVNPKSQISREDMMVIVARALPKAGYKLEKDSAGKFSDAASIAEYATDSVNTLVSSKIVAGSNGKINPKGKTTRAEVAVLLNRIVFMAR